jgi:hypothetical protein
MTTIELLTQQLKDAHQVFLGTLEGITNDQANFQPQGKALSVAAVWIHVVESEDLFLSAISNQPTIESTMASQTGISQPQPTENWAEAYPVWAKSVKADVDQLMQYTKTVFENSEKYIATLQPQDLDQTKDLGQMGSATVLTIISGYMIGHCQSITGEISAIKGVQGLKGYPF